LTQRFDPENVLLIQLFNPEQIITAVYLDNDKYQFNVKRFKIETSSLKNKFFFIKEGEGNYVEAVTTDEEPVLSMKSGKGTQVRNAKFKLAKVAEVMGWKAIGAKLMDFSKTVEMNWEEPPKEEPTNQASLFE
jgi:topoisomerase-4 subunit A